VLRWRGRRVPATTTGTGNPTGAATGTAGRRHGSSSRRRWIEPARHWGAAAAAGACTGSRGRVAAGHPPCHRHRAGARVVAEVDVRVEGVRVGDDEDVGARLQEALQVPSGGQAEKKAVRKRRSHTQLRSARITTSWC